MRLTLAPDAANCGAVSRVVGLHGRRLRVVVADDQPLVRAELHARVNAQPDLEVVGTCSNGMAALLLVHRLEPDVLVLDQDICELDGLTVAAHLEFAGVEIRVVLYTVRNLVGEPIVGGPHKDRVLDDVSVDALMTAIRVPRSAQVATRAN
jgi:DNA-binding NarL/FixJ family response regulator